MLNHYEGFKNTQTIYTDATLLDFGFSQKYLGIHNHIMTDEEQALAHQLNDANHYVGPYARKLLALETLICAEGFDVTFKWGFGEYIVRECSHDHAGIRIYTNK